MINFSFNIIRRKNIHHINLLKARGATNRQVFLALFLEMIIATFFALIIGSAIGVSLIFLIGRTSAFLEFKSEIPIAQYSFTAAGALAGIIIISGLVISLIINIPRMISLSRLKVKNVAGEEERKKKPLWQRIYLDSILGILAIISLIVFLVAVNVDFEQDTQMILTLIFGVSAPILVVTSISFVIARFFTRIIQKLGDKLWSIKTGSFALSIKNLTHQNKQTSRAVILIMITLTFGIVSAVVPATIDYNVYQRSAYVFGADIIILNPELDTLYQENIENLEGVEATSLVVLNDQHEEIDFGWGPLPTSIIGIDPDTFLDAAYMKAWKYGFSNRFTNLLNELSVDGNMLYQRDALEEYNLPDRFSVNFGIELYNVVGTFKAFPNLVKDRNYDQTANEKFIVCNLDTANNLMDSAFIYDRNYILYVKQAKPNTVRSIINNIQSIYPDANVFSAELDTEQNLKMPARISIYAMLNSSFITTVISTIAGLVIYSLLILFDRSKELSLIRALGAFRKEIYRSFLYESLLMLTIGMVIGIPVGIIVAIILSNVINSYYEIPPLMLKIPWLSLIVILASIYVITTIASLIPAHYAAKKEINDLARTI